MKPVVVTQPAVEPIEIEDAKAHLRIAHQSEDATVEGMIVTARIACEQEIARSLITQTRRVYLDAFPQCGEIRIPYGPVQSVTSVGYVDTSGANQTLAGSEWTADLYDDPPRVVPAYGKSFPSTRAVPNAVFVEYVAGYGATGAAVPAAIRSWILLFVGALWENREAVSDVDAKHLGFAAGLVDAYRAVRL